MHDLKFIVENEAFVRERLALRNTTIDLDRVLQLNEERKSWIQKYDVGRHEQRQLSEAFRTKGGDPDALAESREKLKNLGSELKEYESKRSEVEAEIENLLLYIPNLPHESVVSGKGEEDNPIVREVGEKPTFDFEPKEHVAIAEELNLIDFPAAAAISGARFAVYRGAGARLERALMSFMLDLHTEEHGYVEVLTPFLVSREAMLGTGQLPKFEEDAFQTTDGRFLIPTAEVPVTNLHREQIIESADLPISYTAFSACFRQEAGSYGKDTRGLTRLHQFQKVELVKFVRPEDSYDALEALTGHAEEVLKRLGLHYRVASLCSGDLGFTSAKTYDLEVWLPGQDRYREISSCSLFEEWQARRAKIRYRPEPGAKPRHLHTLNGSGVAIGRTVMAILENYQQADGSVMVPEVLRPYMGGLEVIR